MPCGGEAHQHGAAVALDRQADGEALGFEAVDDAGDVAVGDAEHAGELAHLQSVGGAVERGHHVEARERGVDAAQALAQLALDHARDGEDAQPEAQARLGGGDAAGGRSRLMSRLRETEMAWPVTEAAASEAEPEDGGGDLVRLDEAALRVGGEERGLGLGAACGRSSP